jgi:hypothetical protein
MATAQRGSVRRRNIPSSTPKLDRKDSDLQGSYYLAPKTELQTDNGKAIDSVVDSFTSLPILYNEDDPVAMALDRVNVQLPVSVAVNTFPLWRLIVVAVPVLPKATTVSA